MKYQIVFKKGLSVVALVQGIQKIQELTADEGILIVTAEAILEKLTGLRVHINEVHGG